jgi:hypothetical protein
MYEYMCSYLCAICTFICEYSCLYQYLFICIYKYVHSGKPLNKPEALYQFQTEKKHYKSNLRKREENSELTKLQCNDNNIKNSEIYPNVGRNDTKNDEDNTINDENKSMNIDNDIEKSGIDTKNDENIIKNNENDAKNTPKFSHKKCLNDLRSGTILVDNIKITDLLGS